MVYYIYNRLSIPGIEHIYLFEYIYIYIYICVCVCVCVCIRMFLLIYILLDNIECIFFTNKLNLYL